MTTDKREVLLIGPLKPVVVKGLDAICTVHKVAAAQDPDGFIAAHSKVRAIACSDTRESIPGSLMERFPKLEIVASFGVGYDHMDVKWAAAHNVVLTNTPDVLTECTADHAFMMLLAAARRAYEYDRIMRNGWRFRIGQGDLLGVRVTGKTLGILGMGRIGRAMAQRARGFDMRVVYHARNRLPLHQEQGATYFGDFYAMLPECNFLSLHAPATPATDKIIDARALALLPRGAVLVNVSRGGLVDEDALLDALASGQLFGAGLDVFRTEPHYDLRFAKLDNVILSPHVGSASVETRNAMGYRALDNIAAVLAGRGPIDPLW